ncbi:MAG: hypothetical protein ABH839_00400 [Chloroflexota bacterium]
MTYTWEVTSSFIQPVTKIWIEFRKYDPALWYPLGKGRTEEETIETLSERPDSNEPEYVYLREMAQQQPESFVPQDVVVVSGDLNWEGPPLKDGDIVRLNATVSFPEGEEWLLYAWWATEEERQIYDEFRLTVSKESGMFGWAEDYSSGYGRWRSPDEWRPIGITLKPSRAPLLGEPRRLDLILKSIKDLDQAEAGIEVYKMEGVRRIRVPLEDVLAEGSFDWHGSLKKDDPIELTGTFRFPDEGDWWIKGYARALPDGLYGYLDSVFLNVGKSSSRFGWDESHEKRFESDKPKALWPFSCGGP